MAGLYVLEIISEPAAAALAFGTTIKILSLIEYFRIKFLVAIGAAIQAAVLERRRDAPRIFLKNVIPLSLGVLCQVYLS